MRAHAPALAHAHRARQTTCIMALPRMLIPVNTYLDGLLGTLQTEASQKFPAVKFKGVFLDDENEKDARSYGAAQFLSDEDKQLIENAEIIIGDGPFLSHCLPLFKEAKWVHSLYAGVDTLVANAKVSPRFTLTRHVGTSFGQQMGEYVLFQILQLERKWFSVQKNMEQRKWEWMFTAPRTLPSLSIGVLGVGHIGKKIAEMCKLMGMKVWGLTRTSKGPDLSILDHHCYLQHLPLLLESCDYVCNVLPSTPQTKALLNGDILKHCAGKKSVFINVGRGDIVSEAALVNALTEGWLGGAVLDVYEREPLPKDNMLWGTPNVILTPHMSGLCSVKETVSVIMDNLYCYFAGEPLKNTVDFSCGY